MTVTSDVYGIDALQGQLDILNQSVYTTNVYLQFIGVSIALIASVAMFMIGYVVVKRER